MKCLCGYESKLSSENTGEISNADFTESDKFIKKFFMTGKTNQFGQHENLNYEIVYICPKCGLLKIPV
jgi:hypothetical protein